MSSNPENKTALVVIKGAGDLATGVAHRLHRAGYRLLMTDLARPTVIRRTVAFAQAVYQGEITIEGVKAHLAGPEDYQVYLERGMIPVLPQADPAWLESLKPGALIEATLSKRNTGLSREPGRVTVALGPGYQAGQDVEAVIETARGHYLGRVILEGPALPNTGRPGLVGGFDLERLIRSPSAGEVCFRRDIGQWVEAGEVIGSVGGVDVIAGLSGVLRGALQNGLSVPQNFKIGDIDPRKDAAGYVHSPSDKARAVAGGVLEALMYFGLLPGGLRER